MAGDDVTQQSEGYVSQTALKPDEKAVVVDELQTPNKVEAVNVNELALPSVSLSRSGSSLEVGEKARLIYETVLRPVSETIYTPITETVMKEARTIVNENVNETQYKEYAVKVCKRICEPVVQNQCYMIDRPVRETVYRDFSHKVCKTVTETHFKECPKTVKTCVSETVMQERTRMVFSEVQETVCHEVCKSVPETLTCNRVITKLVPETICETVCVRGHLAWKEVPRYECCFDPCTCTIVQKQIGTTRKLIREPAHTVTRQVTRNKTVIEQVPESKVVQRLVFEKVPVTVTKRVPTKICEKVPVTVTRHVFSTQIVKVPYTVTRRVQSIEVVKVPVVIHRRALGAYVDSTSLSPEAAKIACGAEFVTGGPASLCNPGAAIYECRGTGRVFVEGLRGSKLVTQYVTKTIQVTQVRKVPCQVTRVVRREVIKKVPTTITRMVPSTVTRMVPCSTCRLVTGDVAKACPEVVANCQTVVILDESFRPRLKILNIFSEMTPRRLQRLFGPSTGQTCGTSCCSTGGCGSGCGPRISNSATSCSPCGTPCGGYTCNGWFGGLFNRTCHPHPVRDFFSRFWPNRSGSGSYQAAPCSSCVATPVSPQPAPPQKMPPTTLPPLPE
jgi:hypothetical protein